MCISFKGIMEGVGVSSSKVILKALKQNSVDDILVPSCVDFPTNIKINSEKKHEHLMFFAL